MSNANALFWRSLAAAQIAYAFDAIDPDGKVPEWAFDIVEDAYPDVRKLQRIANLSVQQCIEKYSRRVRKVTEAANTN